MPAYALFPYCLFVGQNALLFVFDLRVELSSMLGLLYNPANLWVRYASLQSQ